MSKKRLVEEWIRLSEKLYAADSEEEKAEILIEILKLKGKAQRKTRFGDLVSWEFCLSVFAGVLSNILYASWSRFLF